MALTTVQSGMMDSIAQYNSFKNRIINGAMVIDQRNAGASVTNTTSYLFGTDRWKFFGSVASKFTAQQNAGSVTPPTGYINYLGFTSSSAYSVGASEQFIFNQPIEGLNCADLGWGTASAATVTLSFWVRSSLTGTFGGIVCNSAANRTYPFTYTISAANTWEQKSVTIAGDTTGTWLTTNGVGMFVQLSLGAGSTLSTTAGAWAAGYYASATGATSVVGTSGATFYITGVQLEKGSTATAFDYRPYGTELQLCQRYYWKNIPGAASVNICTGVCATSQARVTVLYPTIMRSAPTFSFLSLYADDEQAAVYTVSSISSINAGAQSARIIFSTTGTIGGRPVSIGTSSTTGFLDASAEL